MLKTYVIASSLVVLASGCGELGWGSIECPDNEFGYCFMTGDGPGVYVVVHPAYHDSDMWFEDYTPTNVLPSCLGLVEWNIECFDGPSGPQCFGEHPDAQGIVFPVECGEGRELSVAPYDRSCDVSYEGAQALIAPVSCGPESRPCTQPLDGANVYTMPACSVW